MNATDRRQRNFAPGEGQPQEPQLSQPGRGHFSGLIGPGINGASNPIEREGGSDQEAKLIPHLIKSCEPSARNVERGIGAGGSTDLCYWEDLEIGEAFYLPFAQAVFYKTGIESYGIAPNEPEWEWRVAGENREPIWIVARAEVMTCRRCGCSELNPCYSFTDGACAWATPGLCTACLSRLETMEFLQGMFEPEAA